MQGGTVCIYNLLKIRDLRLGTGCGIERDKEGVWGIYKEIEYLVRHVCSNIKGK
jgi:hypothetical protein